MMIDIDRFKRINDNYGHALGDKVIKYVAGVLEQEIRQDDLLGRYGGEEFCIVMENMSLKQATDAAERMRRRIAQGDASLFGSALRTTASFGVACMSGDAVSSDELMHRADKALYLAKESGRNKVMAWEACESSSEAESADELVVDAAADESASVVVRPFFGDASVTERDWQLEEVADAHTAELKDFVLPVSREHFCEKNLFVDRVNQALLLARRESRVIGVMSLGVSIARHDTMPLNADLIDLALQSIASRLRSKLRSSDVVVVFPDVASLNALPVVADAELGILLPATCDAEAAGWVAKRVSEILQEPLCVDDQRLTVVTHLGVAMYPTDASDGVTLTQAACVARLFSQSQSAAGGIEFCSGHFNAQFKQKAQLQDDMAIAIDNDEFELLFQPKVAIPGGQIIGFESLLRWNHPKRGVLTPNEFLDIAERTGLINMIGDWVLRQSCRQVARLSEACSRELVCAVNMSVVQLAQPDLVEQVLRALEEEGLPADRLEIELTEEALQGGLDQRFAQLTALQAHGIQVAIDDFGAGCNGLNYLRNLPVNILKVDRHFVADLAENERDSSILEAFLGMAETLGLRVVAEGVESRCQFEALASLNCTEAQGYLFGRPMTIDAAQALLLDATAVAHAG
jgi:diguanylate cyclase (GGDEF)-like protein